jgi:hypothetical protein
MTVARPRFNFISLANWLARFLDISTESGILFLNPVKIVKSIRNQMFFLDDAGRNSRRFY